ncbi:MAG: GIY-YIG nuclease family protein [Pirellulales bacterium]
MPRNQKSQRFYYDQNFGVAGVVYILANRGLQTGWFKIGCSRRSGKIRASELNFDANTGTPGEYVCVYEAATDDCGRAEQSVFQELAKHRRGKRGQEFFEIDLEIAKRCVEKACKAFQTPDSRMGPEAGPKASQNQGAKDSETVQSFESASRTISPSSFQRSKRHSWKTIAAVGVIALFASKAVNQEHTPLLSRPITHETTVSSAQKAPQAKAIAVSVGDGQSQRTDKNKHPASTALTSNTDSMTSFESASIDRVCGFAKQLNGPAAYYQCQKDKIAALRSVKRSFDWAGVSESEVASINSVCGIKNQLDGPAAYYQCVDSKLAAVKSAKRTFDWTGVSEAEAASISSVCGIKNQLDGPAAYYQCVKGQLAALRSTKKSS